MLRDGVSVWCYADVCGEWCVLAYADVCVLPLMCVCYR